MSYKRIDKKKGGEDIVCGKLEMRVYSVQHVVVSYSIVEIKSEPRLECSLFIILLCNDALNPVKLLLLSFGTFYT